MNVNEETISLIDQYLNQELAEAERIQFEARCDSDPEFAQAIREHIQAEYAVRTAVRDKRKQELSQAFDSWTEPEEPPIRPFRWYAVAAACIVILLGLAVAFGVFNSPQTPEMLYAEYFEAEPFSGRRTANEWQAAGDAYTYQNYSEAISILSQLLADTTFQNRPRALYYLGHSYLLSEQPKEALKAFTAVSPESSFIRQSEWYSALIYLKLGDVPSARKSLEKILNTNGHYQRKAAQELLKSLPKSQ